MAKDDIKDIISTLFNDDLDPSRKMMERVWYRNILFYAGEQHLQWVISQNTFRRKYTSLEEPTPTSNMIRDYVRSMKAMILNKKYTVRVWPNSNNQDDILASRVAGDLLIHMDTSDDEAFADEKEKVAGWMILFGTAFMRTFPQKDGGEWAILKNGGLLTTGDVANEAWMPFNVVVDSYGSTLRQKRRIGFKSLKPKEWVEDTFNTSIKAESDHRIVDYQKRLMRMVADVSPWKGAGLVNNEIFDLAAEDLVVFKEIEFRPTEKKPNGRYVVAVGDQILHDKDKMPIPVENGKWYYTLTDFHYYNIPGRFWSDPGVNDQISPQNSVNSIDQALEMNRKGLARPIVFMPTGMTLKRKNEGSQSMIIVEYDSMMTQGQRPEINRGTALPEQVLVERENHLKSAQDSGGDPKGVLRGRNPSSQASGALVDILREAAEQGHTPDVDRFYRKLKEVYKKRLVLAKHIYKEDRIIKVMGKGNSLRIKKFKGSDLRNNTDVRLELDSGISTTNAGKAQMMSEMAKSGVFNDESLPIDIRHELMQKVGLTGIKDKNNIHIERTELENARFACATEDDIIVVAIDGRNVKNGAEYGMEDIMVSVQNPAGGEDIVITHDPIFKMEDHALCMQYHLKFILSPEFKDILPQAQKVAIAHYDTHNAAMDMQQNKLMQKAALAKQLEGQPKQEQQIS